MTTGIELCYSAHNPLDTVKGRARLGVQAFADALLVIPKALAQNGGFDSQACLFESGVCCLARQCWRSLSRSLFSSKPVFFA